MLKISEYNVTVAGREPVKHVYWDCVAGARVGAITLAEHDVVVTVATPRLPRLSDSKVAYAVINHGESFLLVAGRVHRCHDTAPGTNVYEFIPDEEAYRTNPLLVVKGFMVDHISGLCEAPVETVAVEKPAA